MPSTSIHWGIYHSVIHGDDRRRLFHLKRVLAMAVDKDKDINRRRWRRVEPLNIDSILEAIADEYGVEVEQYCGFRRRACGRDVAAILCRRWTKTKSRALSEAFGLSHPDSALDFDQAGQTANGVETARGFGGAGAETPRSCANQPAGRLGGIRASKIGTKRRSRPFRTA
jgi:hypothetical protein